MTWLLRKVFNPGPLLTSCYFGGIRMPPSTRMTSAFMYELVISSSTIDASSSGTPRRGESTLSPSFALNASDSGPRQIGVSIRPGRCG